MNRCAFGFIRCITVPNVNRLAHVKSDAPTALHFLERFAVNACGNPAHRFGIFEANYTGAVCC